MNIGINLVDFSTGRMGGVETYVCKPMLESMAWACPVVFSNSILEIGGGAVHYFDPTSPDQMADSIMKLWNDNAALLYLRVKGIEMAKLFSWEVPPVKHFKSIVIPLAG